MPYKDLESQRKFQREWASKKKQKKLTLENKDGTIKLNASLASTDDLSEIDDINKIKTYRECVRIGRGLVKNKRSDHLKLAAIAIKACEIKLGGSRADGWKERMGRTLKDYAKTVNIHHKTLGDWVVIKKEILDKLTDEEKSQPFNLGIATHLGRRHTRSIPLVDMYRRFNKDPSSLKFSYVVRYLYTIKSNLRNYGASTLVKEELIKFYELLDWINTYAENFKQLRDYREVME